MRDGIGSLKSFLSLIILIGFLIIAIQFRPNQSLGNSSSGAFSSESQNLQVYPPPFPDAPTTPVDSSDSPYPGLEEWNVTEQTNECTKVGTWIEYVNKNANFSFQYPAEADVHESLDSNGYPNVVLTLKPHCYVEECWGANRVDIIVLSNTEKLSLEDFVVEQFTSTPSTDQLALSRELMNYSKTITVDNIKAMQVNGKITQETPRVYVPYNDIVIYIGLTEMKYMPPFEQACPTILDLFSKILSSIKFL